MKKLVSIPEKGETKLRILEHLFVAKTDLERREIAIAWSGYIAALYLSELISMAEHASLCKLLYPHLDESDPVNDIFLGIPDEELERLGFDPKQE
jgi:hypothetical protein